MSTSACAIQILAVMVLITVEPAFAQITPIYRSVEVGVGPSMVSILDNDPQLQHVPKLSFAADMGFSYMMMDNLSVVTHLMYEHKGGKRVVVTPDIETPDVQFNTSSSYVTLSPGLRKYLGTSNIFIEGGPFISFLFHSDTRRGPNGVETRFPIQFATIDVGASGSIGCTPARRQLRGLNFRLVNNLGLSDANANTGTKEITNALSFIVGMRIQSRYLPNH